MSTIATAIRRHLLQSAIRMLDGRRRRLLAWRSLVAADVRTVTVDRDGISWTLPADDASVGFPVFVDGGYQRQEIQALIEWMRCRVALSDTSVLVDVGANIGTTCIPFARETGCRVLAIEPVEDTFQLLKTNVEANGLQDRIVMVRKAVLRSSGKITMQFTKRNYGDSFVLRDDSIVPKAATATEQQEVEAERLTTIVNSAGIRLDEVVLVWADVQGCEADVIESGARLWELGVPLWAEVEPYSLVRQGILNSFSSVASGHFDQFIDRRELVRLGNDVKPVPIASLESLVRDITPRRQTSTDVLFLPSQFRTMSR